MRESVTGDYRNTVGIIVLKYLDEMPAAAMRDRVLPYVRNNYVAKFKDSISIEFFRLFTDGVSDRTSFVSLSDSSGEDDILIIQTNAVNSQVEVFDAFDLANNDDKICRLFSTLYALGIDGIIVYPNAKADLATSFFLYPEAEAEQMVRRSSQGGAEFVLIR